jgi:hypothetical protein
VAPSGPSPETTPPLCAVARSAPGSPPPDGGLDRGPPETNGFVPGPAVLARPVLESVENQA